MGVMDKFLNVMRLNSDEDDDFYDDDDEFYDDDEEFYEPPKRKSRGLGRRAPEPEMEPEPEPEKPRYVFRDSKQTAAEQSRPTSGSKVTPMRQSRKSSGSSSMEVCVIKPTSVEDAKEITETLLYNRTVILNLEGLDLDTAQRIIDFTSGSSYAISGGLQKVSNYIFIVTPANVDISGDFQSIMDAFDSSSFRRDI